MKRTIAIILSVMLILSLSAVCAHAEDGDSAEVYVTISDKDGQLALTAEKIIVRDTDSDSSITINDALYAAHKAFYEDGAAAGYAASVTQYGLGIDKLWGAANGGSYGYYVNDHSAWSLTDPIKDGDHVYAFVYTDPVGWSDNYSYFDVTMGEVEAGAEFDLQYFRAGYDESWNPVTLPVEGAVITIDGEATEITTDANGVATLKLEEVGKHIISATYSAARLTPPVAVITAAEEAVGAVLGDADCDGVVTVMDATAIQRTLASLSTKAFDPKAADADEDGSVTIMDATSIQRHLASLPTNENIGKPYAE